MHIYVAAWFFAPNAMLLVLRYVPGGALHTGWKCSHRWPECAAVFEISCGAWVLDVVGWKDCVPHCARGLQQTSLLHRPLLAMLEPHDSRRLVPAFCT